MQQFPKPLAALIIGIVVLPLLSGCANNEIGLIYTPEVNVTRVSGADRVSVNVEVKDVRLTKAINEPSEGDSAVIATNDVAIVKQAVEEELAHRGFKHSEHAVTVLVGLEKLYHDGLTKATSTLSVQVRKPNGTIVYSETITANAKNAFMPLRETTFWTTLDRALQNSISELFADQSFIHAILKASGNSENSE
jgi:hypothetical protein